MLCKFKRQLEKFTTTQVIETKSLPLGWGDFETQTMNDRESLVQKHPSVLVLFLPFPVCICFWPVYWFALTPTLNCPSCKWKLAELRKKKNMEKPGPTQKGEKPTGLPGAVPPSPEQSNITHVSLHCSHKQELPRVAAASFLPMRRMMENRTCLTMTFFKERCNYYLIYLHVMVALGPEAASVKALGRVYIAVLLINWSSI